ncbi:alpha/beta hydrolase [Herminiimonas sp. CN]|uniref:alpha/beta hydrolase n=1 Tax=Herminiimonas sp. CN TaxID=1349818 RepID=UPI0004737400|nr:alpha/beta hydrolase [Herminiimonas sp. CN]
MNNPTDYYTKQYDARAMISGHSRIYTRWVRESAHVRRTRSGLYDLTYGETAGERLDFFPARRGGAALLVFIHGGWWRSLDKADFSFIAPPYLSAGCNVALLNYTLAPHASIEDITRQQLRALAWLHRHAEQYDFDPQQIVVAGHSAGAHLAAMMMAAIWPLYGPDLPPDLIRAGVLLSGVYDLAPLLHADFINADLKLTAQRADLLSPARIPQTRPTPFLSAVGGQESDEFQRQNSLIGQAWKSSHIGNIALPAENHLTICDAFATPGHPLCEAVVKLVAGQKSD